MSLDDELISTLTWWRDAGVDTIVEDAPRDWFAAARPRAAIAREAEVEAPPAAALADMPAGLDEFRAWLLATDALSAPPTQRIDAIGDPAAGLMILVDQPEQSDTRETGLLSGDAGALFDRMLAAIGRDRGTIYLASLSPARAPGGRIDEADAATCAAIAARHVLLADPKYVLLMGDAPSRAICGTGLGGARGGLRRINHEGGNVSAIATFHPRFLLRQPAAKAESWKDLQMLMGAMTA